MRSDLAALRDLDFVCLERGGEGMGGAVKCDSDLMFFAQSELWLVKNKNKSGSSVCICWRWRAIKEKKMT